MKSNLYVSVCALAALVAAGAGAVACSDSNKASQSATNSDGEEDGSDGSTGGSSSEDGSDASAGETNGTGGETSDGTDGTGGEFVCSYPESSNPPPAGTVACSAGETKNAACTNEGDTCYKNCGPRDSSGWKPLTCTEGIIVEISTCEWTGDDYSAFRVPASFDEVDSRCPTEPPQAGQPCDVDPCVSCTQPGTGAYLDSGGTNKSGWCTCPPGDDDRVWTCGTVGKAWPCPTEEGC